MDRSVYELPRTSVKPFDQVRVEEQDGNLLFYLAQEGTLIHKCPKRESAGGVTAMESGNRKSDPVAANVFMQIFEPYEETATFVARLSELDPRYKNVQFGRLVSLANLYSVDQVAEAISYCVKVEICNVSEVTAFLIYRYGKEYALKRISKNAYYRNKDRADEIRREQNGKYI